MKEVRVAMFIFFIYWLEMTGEYTSIKQYATACLKIPMEFWPNEDDRAAGDNQNTGLGWEVGNRGTQGDH